MMSFLGATSYQLSQKAAGLLFLKLLLCSSVLAVFNSGVYIYNASGIYAFIYWIWWRSSLGSHELQEQHQQQVHNLPILFLGAGNQDGSGSPQTKTMKDYEYVSDYW